MRQPRPFFRKQTRSWYVQFGKRQINLGGDEEAAWEQYHKLMIERQTPTLDTVCSVFNRYLGWVKDNRSDHTFRKKRKYLRTFAQHIGPKLKVDQLKRHHVQGWISATYPSASPTTQNNAIGEVQIALNWAADLDLIAKNPIAKMEKPTPNVREFFVAQDYWSELLGIIPDQEFSDYVTVSLLTGARPQEMRVIEARHLDRKHFRLVFSREESKGKRRSRVIYLPPAAFEIVDRLARQHPEGKIFRNTKGNPWTKDAISCRFKRLKVKLGLPDICATSLRHSFATAQLINGTDSHVVSKLMGHADGRMLAMRYGHIDQNPDYMIEQVSRIGDLLSANPTEAELGPDGDTSQNQPV